MKRTLLIVAGPPATGKSFFINKLKEQNIEFQLIIPDKIKENYADRVGFDNLVEKKELEEFVWRDYYELMAIYMRMGEKLIVSEYPFSELQKGKLKYLCSIFSYQIITLRLVGDFDILWNRRFQRDREPSRHLSHLMSKYHYGDQLLDRDKADCHITKDEFQNKIQTRDYNNFSLGHLISVDVSNFEQVNYDLIIQELKSLII